MGFTWLAVGRLDSQNCRFDIKADRILCATLIGYATDVE